MDLRQMVLIQLMSSMPVALPSSVCKVWPLRHWPGMSLWADLAQPSGSGAGNWKKLRSHHVYGHCIWLEGVNMTNATIRSSTVTSRQPTQNQSCFSCVTLPLGCPKRVHASQAWLWFRFWFSNKVFIRLVKDHGVKSVGKNSGNQCYLRARALWGKCTFLFATDRPALRLGEELRMKALEAGTACLSAYSALSAMNLANGRLNYKIRPKW